MTRLVKRRTQQIVHACVDHDPSRRACDLRLNDARQKDAVGGDERTPWCDAKRRIAQPRSKLLGAGSTNEVRRPGQPRGPTVRLRDDVPAGRWRSVINPESSPSIDERKRLPATVPAQVSRDAKNDARQLDVPADARELRACVGRNPDELQVLR